MPASARFDWDDLRVFLQVVESGAIGAAAKELGLTQPTVSVRLRDLEMRLNSKLLVRTAQGVAPTEVGERVRKHAAQMLLGANAVELVGREHDEKEEGRVRLTAPDGVASTWIAPRLSNFLRLNPQISISIDAGLWPDSPVRDELDVSLQYVSGPTPGNKIEPIATVHYAPFASEDYLKLYGVPKNLAEMANHRTVHHSAVQEQKETWDRKAEAMRTLSSANIETNSSMAVFFAVLAGAGIAYMPTAVAAFTPGLRMLGEDPSASPILYLSYSETIANVARVKRLIEWLKEIFDPDVYPWFSPTFVHPREYSMMPGVGRFDFEPPEI